MSGAFVLLGTLLASVILFSVFPDRSAAVVDRVLSIVRAGRAIVTLIFALVLIFTGIPTFQLLGAVILLFYVLYIFAFSDVGPIEDIRRRL